MIFAEDARDPSTPHCGCLLLSWKCKRAPQAHSSSCIVSAFPISTPPLPLIDTGQGFLWCRFGWRLASRCTSDEELLTCTWSDTEPFWHRHQNFFPSCSIGVESKWSSGYGPWPCEGGRGRPCWSPARPYLPPTRPLILPPLFLSGSTPPANPLPGSGFLLLCSVQVAWKTRPRSDHQVTRRKMGKPSRRL